MWGPLVLAALCFVVHVEYVSAYGKAPFGPSSFQLNILHTNDIHSRILESDQWGGECGEKRRDRTKCFGGVARIAQKVREFKSTHRNTLFLNAGGFFRGTLWYSTLKHKIASYAMTRMGYNAIGLGNNEFDDGPEELAPFVRDMSKAGVGVIGTNIDASREPRFRGVSLPSYRVFIISGVKVAVLAVVPTATATISRPGGIKILPEAESINRETWRLKQQGVKIFVLISHLGFEGDKRLAVACPDLDVIVGGHSKTFLYTGTPPVPEDKRRVRGPYPFLVPRRGHRSCLLVQAYRYGKYLGHLELLFNRNGEVTHWRGKPILLDQSVGQDTNILRGLVPFKRIVEDALKKVVGSTKVLLEGSDKVCRFRECNLGNLITDSLLDYYANKRSKVPHAWSEVNAAVITGGTLKGSIKQSSSVTLQDLQRAMPIDNELVVMNMNGAQLRQMFEHAVSNFTWHPKINGKFLQVSGMQVSYDLGRQSGWRVARLRILCANCSVPRYEDVIPSKRYTIVTTSFIANGGDGFECDKGILKRSEGVSAFLVFTKYFTKLSPIKTAEDGRVVVKNLPSRGKPVSPGQRPTPGIVPGQTPVPGSIPGLRPTPGFGPSTPQIPGPVAGQPQIPGTTQGGSQLPGFRQGQPQILGPVAGQSPIPGPAQSTPQLQGFGQNQPQLPGPVAGQPQIPGTAQGQPQLPGFSQGEPQIPGPVQVQPQTPAPAQGQSQFPGFSQGQPQVTGPVQGPSQIPGFGLSQPPISSSAQGQPQIPLPAPGQPQIPGFSQGPPQPSGPSPGQPQLPGFSQGPPPTSGPTPGQPQLSGFSEGQPQSSGPVQGTSQLPGLSLGQPPISGPAQGQPPITGSAGGLPQMSGPIPGQSQLPGFSPGQPQLPGLASAPPQSPGVSQGHSPSSGFGLGTAPSTGMAPTQAQSTGFGQGLSSFNGFPGQSPNNGLGQVQPSNRVFNPGQAPNTGLTQSQTQNAGYGQAQTQNSAFSNDPNAPVGWTSS